LAQAEAVLVLHRTTLVTAEAVLVEFHLAGLLLLPTFILEQVVLVQRETMELKAEQVFMERLLLVAVAVQIVTLKPQQ
jgi:hypothetical protein